MVHNSKPVLTYNPEDEWASSLIEVVKEKFPEVTLSKVRGFGPPELRTGEGWYIYESMSKILEYLHNRYPVSAQG